MEDYKTILKKIDNGEKVSLAEKSSLRLIIYWAFENGFDDRSESIAFTFKTKSISESDSISSLCPRKLNFGDSNVDNNLNRAKMGDEIIYNKKPRRRDFLKKGERIEARNLILDYGISVDDEKVFECAKKRGVSAVKYKEGLYSIHKEKRFITTSTKPFVVDGVAPLIKSFSWDALCEIRGESGFPEKKIEEAEKIHRKLSKKRMPKGTKKYKNE